VVADLCWQAVPREWGVGVDDYLVGLPEGVAARVKAANAPGLAALRRYLDAGNAIAFLGAGVSVPLYPLWNGVIDELIDAATDRGLDVVVATTLRELATEQPDAVVEDVRRYLGVPQYHVALRQTFRVRRDATTGQTWTPTQELVCRVPFAGAVTTNYDPGIVDARIRVRPRASSTGFASWTDELRLDDWLTGDVFGTGEELPVLFAHGHHNQPDAMVLATTEYRRAYAGKLARVLGRLIESRHLVWIGFSFADARIKAILGEVAEHAGTRIEPGRAARHIAVMPWDPASDRDPATLCRLAQIQYGADLILYPAADSDHSALGSLLATVADARFPTPATNSAEPVTVHETPAAPTQSDLPVVWVPQVEAVSAFVGRVEELGRLDRWAGDPGVRLVGVSAWGGAGKTTLVAEWLRRGGARLRPGARGVFGWSFYADPSVEHWTDGLLAWSRDVLKVDVSARASTRVRTADVVLALLAAGVVVVLDGLEVVQEGPAGNEFGRLLDGELREVLTGACRSEHAGLVVLTSRFPFADLEGFDGGAARMLELPPLTPAEGAAVLAESGAGWVPDASRLALVAAVDGHALAVSAMGGVLADRRDVVDVDALREELLAAGRTDARVAKVLRFYADRLAEPDRWLVAAVGLFAHPVAPEALLSVAGHEVFGGRLAGWTPSMVREAVMSRLSGLLSWHPDGTVSAHPLVRDAFRPLALGAAQLAADAALWEVPEQIATREDGLRVVEAIELLLDADQWQAADQLYFARTGGSVLWLTLPAARLGQRAASAFVGTPARRAACPERLPPQALVFYLNEVGLNALNAGDLTTAVEYLQASADHARAGDQIKFAGCLTNLADCYASMGRLADARTAADEALSLAEQTLERALERDAYAFLGWVAALAGDTAETERQFLAADRIQYADPDGEHLISLRAARWGEFLAATGRPGPARRLTDRSRQISTVNGWNENLARCDRLLAVLDIVDGSYAMALDRATTAAGVLRDGEVLTELADTLPVLADAARAAGDLPAAHRWASEALDLAGPRGMTPAHAAALTARARVHADQAAATADPGLQDTLIRRGRDDADAALRLAQRHGLAWQELGALDAHARLDDVEQHDRQWAATAAALRARLIPSDLDPDPLATVERLVAAEWASDCDEDDE
jgi:tetratricopeptide (TPR) repeat protein